MKNYLTLLLLCYVGIATAQQPIDSSEVLQIGGIKQFIKINGADRTKPIMLFLMGGPGESSLGIATLFSKKLQQHVVFVQWDQRNCGRTLQLNKSPEKLSINLYKRDTHDLIDSILKQFHQEKLYLMGWSWGTVLGFYIADKYPELLNAYFAVSPVIDQQKSEEMVLHMLLEKAEKEGNKEETAELSQVRIPFENGEQLYYDRKWLFIFDGQKINERTLPKQYILNWSLSWLALFNETMKQNLIESMPALKCPVYFFVGRKDYQTNFSITASYYNKLISPKKDLLWFEKSGHKIPLTEPDLFQDIVIQKVLQEKK